MYVGEIRNWVKAKKTISAPFANAIHLELGKQFLIEEIKHQPEPVLREVLHYLKFLERQRAQEEWADVLPSREVEQEKLDSLVADTWEKLGPAPEVDYDQL